METKNAGRTFDPNEMNVDEYWNNVARLCRNTHWLKYFRIVEESVANIRVAFCNFSETHVSFKQILDDREITEEFKKIEENVERLSKFMDRKSFCNLVLFTCRVIHFQKHFEGSSLELRLYLSYIDKLVEFLDCPVDQFDAIVFSDDLKSVFFRKIIV